MRALVFFLVVSRAQKKLEKMAGKSSALAAHFVSVLCVVYVGVIVIVAGNRLLSIINDNMF